MDASGNVYVTGYSTGTGTGYDYATVKYDAAGNELWVARYNGPGNGSDYGRDVAIDASGNSYVTGYSTGSGTGYDFATIKYDASGNEMGLARYDGPFDDQGFSIAVGPSGNVCVTGNSVIIGHSNDIMTIMYHSPLGWAAQAELPEPPSGKREGAGGWLAYNAGDLKIYAAKGDGTPDFYAFDTRTNAWAPLTPIPAGTEEALPQDGCRGVTDGGDRVYMTKGANTLGFWEYTISTAGWTQLGDVPAGKQNVKGGTDLAYVPVDDVGYVYLLKGQGCEFYRYNTQTGEWSPLADAPRGKTGQWLAGSWLVYDGDHSLYAHKALSQEMYCFDLTSGTWDPTAITGMPQESRDGGKLQLGPGGCAAWLDGVVYALKGNNTNQLWAYVPVDGWYELDAVPETGTSGQKKRVHLGGDITATENMLFAFKGSKTNELWRHVPYPELGGDGPEAGFARLGTGFALSVSPNPMRLGAAIRYAVPAANNVSLKLYDITGALAKTVRSGWVEPGSYTANLSAKGLARGVYILKLRSDACNLTRKVVIE
jgi:hypothetical protein